MVLDGGGRKIAAVGVTGLDAARVLLCANFEMTAMAYSHDF